MQNLFSLLVKYYDKLGDFSTDINLVNFLFLGGDAQQYFWCFLWRVFNINLDQIHADSEVSDWSDTHTLACLRLC